MCDCVALYLIKKVQMVMYRKYFFKNKGILSRKFVASGLAAAFSSGMFGSYAGAMQALENINYLLEPKEINHNGDLTTQLVKYILSEPALEKVRKKLENKRWILESFFNKEYLEENLENLCKIIPSVEDLLTLYVSDFIKNHTKTDNIKVLKYNLKSSLLGGVLNSWILHLPSKVEKLKDTKEKFGKENNLDFNNLLQSKEEETKIVKINELSYHREKIHGVRKALSIIAAVVIISAFITGISLSAGKSKPNTDDPNKKENDIEGSGQSPGPASK